MIGPNSFGIVSPGKTNIGGLAERGKFADAEDFLRMCQLGYFQKWRNRYDNLLLFDHSGFGAEHIGGITITKCR